METEPAHFGRQSAGQSFRKFAGMVDNRDLMLLF
jgi:hypothetical protein